MTDFNLNKFQEEQNKWVEHNFPNTNADEQILGVVEEVGELCHAILKSKQKIRGGENQSASQEKEMDAIGDILIYLTGFCNKRGYNLAEIINNTWNQVKDRDWVKYPKTGKPIEEIGPSGYPTDASGRRIKFYNDDDEAINMIELV